MGRGKRNLSVDSKFISQVVWYFVAARLDGIVSPQYEPCFPYALSSGERAERGCIDDETEGPKQTLADGEYLNFTRACMLLLLEGGKHIAGSTKRRYALSRPRGGN